MSRSKKWRLEWSFFLGENGRRRYNKICKGCVHPCKQSFRAVLIACPHYQSACSARRKILCKRFSTKSRMALENRADSGLDPLITESHGGQNGMCAGTA